MAGSFREPHIAGYHCLEDFFAEVSPDLCFHLAGQVHSAIEHGEDNALEFQVGIEPRLHEPYGSEKVRESLEGIILALERDQHRVGGREGIDREEAQGGWTVEKGVAKAEVLYLLEALG